MELVVSVMPKNLEEAQNIDSLRYNDADIIEKFAGRELIFTLRTIGEGGKIELTDDEYISIIKEVSTIYQPDYIDFEYFSHKDRFEEMLDFPNLVLSYHNFEETPENWKNFTNYIGFDRFKLVFC